MITEQALSSGYHGSSGFEPSILDNKLEALRQRVNDETYLCAAIQRLALVMSNELMDITKEGGYYERKRRK